MALERAVRTDQRALTLEQLNERPETLAGQVFGWLGNSSVTRGVAFTSELFLKMGGFSAVKDVFDKRDAFLPFMFGYPQGKNSLSFLVLSSAVALTDWTMRKLPDVAGWMSDHHLLPEIVENGAAALQEMSERIHVLTDKIPFGKVLAKGKGLAFWAGLGAFLGDRPLTFLNSATGPVFDFAHKAVGLLGQGMDPEIARAIATDTVGAGLILGGVAVGLNVARNVFNGSHINS